MINVLHLWDEWGRQRHSPGRSGQLTPPPYKCVGVGVGQKVHSQLNLKKDHVDGILPVGLKLELQYFKTPKVRFFLLFFCDIIRRLNRLSSQVSHTSTSSTVQVVQYSYFVQQNL